MKSLLKSLLLSPTNKKYSIFQEYFKSILKDREKSYDAIVEYVSRFYKEQGSFPTIGAIKKAFSATQETILLSFVEALESPDIVAFEDETEYITHCLEIEKVLFDSDVQANLKMYQQDLKLAEKKDLKSSAGSLDELIMSLHKTKNKIIKGNESTSGLLYGEAAMLQLQEIYSRIQERKRNEDFLYYTTGYKKLEEVKMAKGDLVVIGGFTSHGKSIILRNIVYRLLTEYGMSCYYCSLEMPYEKMKLLFLALHANNPKFFPNGPKISYTKLKEGDLTQEEADFVFGKVAPDLFTNPKFGTLFMEYPNKSRYRLSDIKTRISELETSVMPIHAVAIDYITMLYPLESDKGSPDRQDYNQMIKEFKGMALSHRNNEGLPAPFLALTPAQISRGGLENAMKNNDYYDLSALREYSELESSADIVLTTMLLPVHRDRNVIRMQNLKNRDGAVEIEPVELGCELKLGFNILDPSVQVGDEMANRNVVSPLHI